MRTTLPTTEPHAKPSGGVLWTATLVAGLALLGVGAALALRRGAPPDSMATPPPASTTKPAGRWFEEVAVSSGIEFHYHSGQGYRRYFPELMGGGAGLFDYDRDGHLDVYLVQGGSVLGGPGATGDLPGNKLFRNLGDGTFADVTEAAGVGDLGYGMGCACGDFDNDGWTDLYVTNLGANVLYRNNGDGTFSDVSASAGVDSTAFGVSAAFADFDRDGYLDLFVVNYIRWSVKRELDCVAPDGQPDYCSPTAYSAPAIDTLYRNLGDGTFEDVTRSAGISVAYGNGLGVVCADFDGDGWMDIAVANDLTPNQLWMNQGNGRFLDEASFRAIAYNEVGVVEAGMGIDAQDVDGDGDLDLLMTHFYEQTNTLYINDGGFFVDKSARLGFNTSLPFSGFGTALIDLNNDGFLDNYVVNGRVARGDGEVCSEDPYAEPNLLLEGDGTGLFREVTPRGGTGCRDQIEPTTGCKPLCHSSRAAAFGDYDNDGDIDIFVVNRDGPVYVLNNQASERPASGQTETDANNHWIIFRVLNQHGSDAIGARVEIDFQLRGVGQADRPRRRQRRDVRAAYSYCSSNDPRVHFGLGQATRVDQVTVTWPDGTAETFGPFAADQIVDITRSRRK